MLLGYAKKLNFICILTTYQVCTVVIATSLIVYVLWASITESVVQVLEFPQLETGGADISTPFLFPREGAIMFLFKGGLVKRKKR